MANTVNHLHAAERIAVLLNANARAVNEKVRAEIARFVPAEDVFYSRSLDDARAIARTVVARGYSTVFVGGGDGTFVGFVNAIQDRLQAGSYPGASRGGLALKLRPEPKKGPRFGVLKLGTGNSLASVVGARSGAVGVVEDVLRARAAPVRTRSFDLIEVEGKRTIFAGVGLDALILNEYVGWKKRFSGTLLAPIAQGGPGYFGAITLRSIPRFVTVFGRQPMVRAVHTGKTQALAIDPSGRVARTFAPGETMYEGPAVIAAAGTIPCYGFGFKIFPHAGRRPGMMHLRLSNLGLTRTLASVPGIWKGKTPSSGVFDFLTDGVHLEFDRALPFQNGGDAEGWRREVDFSMADMGVEVLDYTPEEV